MSEAERRCIDSELAFHSAPTLLGVKCANLISFRMNESTITEYISLFSERMSEAGLSVKLLCKCREHTLVYIYSRKMLEAWLAMPQVSGFLSDCGYSPEASTEAKIDMLAERISCGSFPHEIGAFLGYPIGDIKGFISNSGKNCLLCGYWKVYENEEKARQTFEVYDRCRVILFDRLNHGFDLYQAVK